MKYVKSMPEAEETRWQGRPDLAHLPKGKFSGSDLVMLVLVGGIMVFLGFTIGPTLAGSFAGLALWAAIIAVLAAILWFFKGGRKRMEINRLSRMSYALGPRSMFVRLERKGKPPQIMEFLVTAQDRIRYDGNEPGTVALFEPGVDRSTMQSAYYSRFTLIHDAAKVYEMMRAMQEESAARQAQKD